MPSLLLRRLASSSAIRRSSISRTLASASALARAERSSSVRVRSTTPEPPRGAAGAVGRDSGGDPMANESRLKTLLASQPESGSLNFALGNLYSRQGRWSEAQQVYFNAVAADADNPDYLFNLAVSLDHLRQPRLAAHRARGGEPGVEFRKQRLPVGRNVVIHQSLPCAARNACRTSFFSTLWARLKAMISWRRFW